MPPHVGDVSEWHRAVARVMEALHTPELGRTLFLAMRHVAPFSSGVILAYREADRPLVLYEELNQPETPDMERYLEGPYLLDPFYQAFASGRGSGLYRLNQLAPDRFRQSRYYQSYY